MCKLRIQAFVSLITESIISLFMYPITFGEFNTDAIHNFTHIWYLNFDKYKIISFVKDEEKNSQQVTFPVFCGYRILLFSAFAIIVFGASLVYPKRGFRKWYLWLMFLTSQANADYRPCSIVPFTLLFFYFFIHVLSFSLLTSDWYNITVVSIPASCDTTHTTKNCFISMDKILLFTWYLK